MKMKFGICGILLLGALSGCFFRPPAFDRHDYEVGEIGFVSQAAVPVKIGPVRNLSGADRRFLCRAQDNEMINNEENNWLLLPGVMLERELTHCFHAQCGRNPIIVDTTLRRFELNEEGTQFRFAVLYELRRGGQCRTLSFDGREAVTGKNVSAALAAAMQKSFIALDRAVREFPAENGKGK